MAIGYGYWLLAICYGYWLWLLAMAIGYGYWLAFIVTSIVPFVWLVQFGAWCLLGVS
jgi:hypothetical protein